MEVPGATSRGSRAAQMFSSIVEKDLAFITPFRIQKSQNSNNKKKSSGVSFACWCTSIMALVISDYYNIWTVQIIGACLLVYHGVGVAIRATREPCLRGRVGLTVRFTLLWGWVNSAFWSQHVSILGAYQLATPPPVI